MTRKYRQTVPRVVQAPHPVLFPGAPLPFNRVEFVVLGAGEDVAWNWTCEPGGTCYVSGYTIVRRRRVREVHPRLIVTLKSGKAMLKQTRTGKPTKALRDLMRNGD